MGQSRNKFSEGRRVRLEEGFEVEREENFLSLIGGVGIGEGGLGTAAACGGEVVPFSSFDLGGETAEERGAEIRRSGAG